MDAIKKILIISVLVGLLGAANSAIADLGIQLQSVAGAPTGYRTYGIMATTGTKLGAMEMVFSSSAGEPFYQVGSPIPLEGPGAEYDTYLTMPGSWQVLGSAVDITSAAEAWGGTYLNKMWAPLGGQNSGPGTFQVGRVTIPKTTAASYTIMGWEGGQTGDGSILQGGIAIAPMDLFVVPSTGSGISGYDRYLDFYADVTTNLGAMELLLNTNAAGGIYRVSGDGVNNPNHADPYESYVSTGYGTPAEQFANTELLSAAVDIAGTSTVQTFTNKDIDLMWAPTGGTQTDDGLFHIARVTLADTASGSWTLMGWQGGGDAFTISGDILSALLPGDVDGDGFVDGDDLDIVIANWGLTGATRAQGDLTGEGKVGGLDYNEVLGNWPPPEPPGPIPEPVTLSLLAAGGVLALIRRRRA